MTKKLYTLISTIVGSVGAIASAVVTYCQPSGATAIVAGIGIAVVAINDIMLLFVKEQETKK